MYDVVSGMFVDGHVPKSTKKKKNHVIFSIFDLICNNFYLRKYDHIQYAGRCRRRFDCSFPLHHSASLSHWISQASPPVQIGKITSHGIANYLLLF